MRLLGIDSSPHFSRGHEVAGASRYRHRPRLLMKVEIDSPQVSLICRAQGRRGTYDESTHRVYLWPHRPLSRLAAPIHGVNLGESQVESLESPPNHLVFARPLQLRRCPRTGNVFRQVGPMLSDLSYVRTHCRGLIGVRMIVRCRIPQLVQRSGRRATMKASCASCCRHRHMRQTLRRREKNDNGENPCNSWHDSCSVSC